MTDLRIAAQQALEALKMMRDEHDACPACDHADAAIYALKAALAEPPFEVNFCSRCGKRTRDVHSCTPPPKL